MGQKLKFKGTIHRIMPVETFQSGFRKRNVVIKTEDGQSKYPDYALFEFVKFSSGTSDATAIPDGFREGDTVTVDFYLTARESKAKPGQWFGSCRAVAMAREGAADPVNLVGDVPDVPDAPADADAAVDELPF